MGVCEGYNRQTITENDGRIKETKVQPYNNDYLLVQMRELAEQQRFEEAQQLKEKYDAIIKYQLR